MRALDPEVVDAVWAAVEPLLPPPPPDDHPLGCHRRRVPDRVVFDALFDEALAAYDRIIHLEPGAVGENLLLPAGDETRAERLPDKCTIQLKASDVLWMLTPGGGGWGVAFR
jgi:hypothetical protein